jgi:PAS domain S-box-containing protein
MSRNKTIILFLIAFVSVFYSNQTKAQYTYIEEQKANLIYQFPQFLFWEGDDYIDVINIGIYKGSDEMIKELKKSFKKKYQNGTKAELIEFGTLNDYKNSTSQIQMLYVEAAYTDEYETILKAAKSKSTALITENWDVSEKFMFDLFEETSVKINFKFNRENIVAANISILDQISILKGIDIDAQQLLIEAQEDLETVQESLIEKQEEIKVQQKELETQKAKIVEQKEEIEEQEASILEQKTVLSELIVKAKEQQIELAAKNTILDNQTSQIQIQQQQLLAQQEEYEQQMALLDQQEELLENQKTEFEKFEKEIEAKQKELVKLGITIQLQRYALLILAGLVSAIIILVFFVFRGYRIKKKQNQQLEAQKEEIQAQAEELEAINVELEKLSIVASETSSAVAILDSNGNFEWVNAGFTRLYGYTFQLLTNELDENIKGVSSHPKIGEIFARCLHNKKTEIFETNITTRDGQKLWAQTTMTPILDSLQNIAKIVLIDSDITIIKEAEEEIKRQNEMILAQTKELEGKNKELAKLSLVAEKTTNSVIIANAQGEIEWVNAGFERLMELSFDEYKQQYGSNLMSADLNPEILEAIEKNLKEKTSATYTTKTATKKGKDIWTQTTLTPIFNEDGTIYRLVAIEADITKVKLAEQEIARQNQKITESIHYAKRIQEAVIPPEEFVMSLLPDSFILFLPKDIVSGDFYWVTKVDKKILFTAADCTGHGVPGAFMSMLGISFLNEIINKLEYDKISPGIILTKLREEVKSHLRQTGKDGEAKDGMDIAFCMYDEDKNQLHYSGAHNPLLLMRNNELIQYKADEMPIGIYYGEKDEFTNNIIDIQKDDLIYLFSDGYPDQFGGKHKRKYMIKRFRDKLVEIHHEPLQMQKQILLDELKNWMGPFAQLDDILVMAVKF